MENVHLNTALKEAGKLIKKKLKSAAASDGFKASGELNKSFSYTAAANELSVFASKYAGALSEGVKTRKDANKSSEEFRNSIIKWAKSRGITPRRNKKGRFTSYMSMANAIAISIRRRGISKRFGYKGSGFIQEVKKSMESKISNIILEGYKKDLKEQLNKINK
tara:strand:+ start:3879 stop:4370 length:492 start_codon:yes stop_codon:yes gene_type:complete